MGAAQVNREKVSEHFCDCFDVCVFVAICVVMFVMFVMFVMSVMFVMFVMVVTFAICCLHFLQCFTFIIFKFFTFQFVYVSNVSFVHVFFSSVQCLLFFYLRRSRNIRN